MTMVMTMVKYTRGGQTPQPSHALAHPTHSLIPPTQSSAGMALFENLDDGVSLAEFVELFAGVTQEQARSALHQRHGA